MKMTINGVVIESNDPKEIEEMLKFVQVKKDEKQSPLAPKVKAKRVKKGEKPRWTDYEINTLKLNFSLPAKKLKKMLGNTHTTKAIDAMKCVMRKKQD